MRDLIKKILQEQETSDDNMVQAGTYNDYDAWRKMTPEERKDGGMPKLTRQLEKNIFLKVLRHVVREFPKSWFIEHAENDTEPLMDRIEPEFSEIFKLYGLKTGYAEPGSMPAKIFYAALDNYEDISTGRDKELYEFGKIISKFKDNGTISIIWNINKPLSIWVTMTINKFKI